MLYWFAFPWIVLSALASIPFLGWQSAYSWLSAAIILFGSLLLWRKRTERLIAPKDFDVDKLSDQLMRKFVFRYFLTIFVELTILISSLLLVLFVPPARTHPWSSLGLAIVLWTVISRQGFANILVYSVFSDHQTA